MHIATFYSFKGGSGRSMALINVAAELAKAGMKVLVVDFDLEAPGLDTFNLPAPSKGSDGVVDFVLQYLKTAVSPCFKDFVYQSHIPNVPGELWVMPAGRDDENYDGRFKSINWRELYEKREGYLLFEDLKQQWLDKLNPDYVLIDSRTGHTDMSGICTRQLPDSVFLFIFPTEQNRRGLHTVVEKIRHEAETERKKEIKLHLVFANVPDLDDEESYIANSIGKTEESLGFISHSAVIHHYSSAFLLTQPIFTIERPRTKLAQEYQELTRVVRRDNLKDRSVALEFIDDISRSDSFVAEELETRLLDIEREHKNDTEVLTALSKLYHRLGNSDSALRLLDEGREPADASSEFYLTRSRLNMISGRVDASLSDLRSALQTDDAGYIAVSSAATTFLNESPADLDSLLESPAFRRLTDKNKYWLTNVFLQKRESVGIAYNVLREIDKKKGLADELRAGIRIHLSIVCIASQRFDEACKVILNDGKKVSDLSLEDSFNYAIARWGIDHEPSKELFGGVVDREKVATRGKGANLHQCIALALWAIGDVEGAYTRLEQSREAIAGQARPEFSCWSYLHMNREMFNRDLDEMTELIGGKPIKPRYLEGS